MQKKICNNKTFKMKINQNCKQKIHLNYWKKK